LSVAIDKNPNPNVLSRSDEKTKVSEISSLEALSADTDTDIIRISATTIRIRVSVILTKYPDSIRSIENG
jgi:hypothetical protein